MKEYKTARVKLGRLKVDKTLQHRIRARGQLFGREFLDELKENVKDIGVVRAIKVVELSKNDVNPLTEEAYTKGDLIVFDGIHRTICLREILDEEGRDYNDEETIVEIWSGGSFSDAVSLSCSANADNAHSYRRNVGDKKQAIIDYIEFMKADATSKGKIIFPFKYADWAEKFKCNEKSLKQLGTSSRLFREELRAKELQWITELKGKGFTNVEISQLSRQICYEGLGLNEDKIRKTKPEKSPKATFFRSSTEQPDCKQTAAKARPEPIKTVLHHIDTVPRSITATYHEPTSIKDIRTMSGDLVADLNYKQFRDALKAMPGIERAKTGRLVYQLCKALAMDGSLPKQMRNIEFNFKTEEK
ncbi:hypothetical protein JF50_20195 [Pseudoalteromonas luteoviolacea]|uniref:Uncharacterized protein n=1 Tax=Pseudoalteromonas luteoviolacea TaxID=43657 RepID=A0A0C1Q4P8_9GAMM|nr:hypothetical protein [Pseudoalteromonas luteoviolacea]KID55531.1 hypothetical protein JF50_20195 [Pseudoalteromonas luteoviolacea]